MRNIRYTEATGIKLVSCAHGADDRDLVICAILDQVKFGAYIVNGVSHVIYTFQDIFHVFASDEFRYHMCLYFGVNVGYQLRRNLGFLLSEN